MEATGAKDYRRECKYGAKCYQKNPEHKSKFKHSAREQDEKENRENQADMAENNKRQHSDTEDVVEAKKARNLECSDDVVDAKEVRHHDLSDSEGGDTSQEGEEEFEKEKKR